MDKECLSPLALDLLFEAVYHGDLRHDVIPVKHLIEYRDWVKENYVNQEESK